MPQPTAEVNPLPAAAGFVLAGGKSSRMGRDKALLMLNGEPLIAHALRSLGAVCAEVAIAGATSDLAPYGRVIRDLTPGSGPLSGVVSALNQTMYDWNLFLAVDVPAVPATVWQQILAVAATGASPTVMASSGGFVHPLCAAFHRSTLQHLSREHEAGRYKLKLAAAAAGPVTYVTFLQHDWFRNINTPEEFAEISQDSRIR